MGELKKLEERVIFLEKQYLELMESIIEIQTNEKRRKKENPYSGVFIDGADDGYQDYLKGVLTNEE